MADKAEKEIAEDYDDDDLEESDAAKGSGLLAGSMKYQQLEPGPVTFQKRRLLALVAVVAVVGWVAGVASAQTRRRVPCAYRAAEDRATEDRAAPEAGAADHRDHAEDGAAEDVGAADDHSEGGPIVTPPTAEKLAQWRLLALQDPTFNATSIGPVRLSDAAKASMGLVDLLMYEEYLEPGCHDVAHAIGKGIYAALGNLDAALTACDYRCTGGCLHGAIRGFVAAGAGTPEVLAEVWQVLVENKIMNELTTIGETAHGFGHTLVLAGLSLEASLAFCATGLEGALGRDDVQASLSNYCSGGVWMQSGNASAQPLLTDRITHCAKAPPLNRLACFYYALRDEWRTCACCSELPECPSQHCGEAECRVDAAEDAAGGAAVSSALLGLCAGLADGPRQACLYGAASSAMFPLDAFRHVEATVAFCEDVPVGRDREACIDGLVFRASKNFATAADTQICPRLASKDDRDFCFGVAHIGQYSLEKEATFQAYAV